jgi:hypothetical protein
MRSAQPKSTDTDVEPKNQPELPVEQRTNGAEAPRAAERQPDVFDNLENIRMDPSQEQAATRKTVLRIQVRKPKAQEFIRAHPTLELTLHGLIDEENRDDHYIVSPSSGLLEILAPFIRPVQAVPCLNRQGTYFLWPLKLPGERSNPWTETARMAMEAARIGWVQVRSNLDNGSYEIVEPIDALPDPIWPELTMSEYLRLGYGRHKFIDSADHPMVLRLLGRLT